MRPMRIRVEVSDLDSIKAGSELHQRAAAQIAQDTLEPHQIKYLKYAMEHLHEDGDLEFDDDAAVSLGDDDGAYVMCWKWVSSEAAGIPSRNE
jgi:hypothetical protein